MMQIKFLSEYANVFFFSYQSILMCFRFRMCGI